MSVTTKSALAAELGISRGRVSQYMRRGMPELPDGKLDRERCLRWIVRSHYQRYGGDHGARRARDLIADGYAGEREPGDRLRYALKPDGSTELYRLDRGPASRGAAGDPVGAAWFCLCGGLGAVAAPPYFWSPPSSELTRLTARAFPSWTQRR